MKHVQLLNPIRQNTRGQHSLAASMGFTLIELIVVIILLGILATSVAPKFFTSQGFEEYAYRAEVVSKLRTIQLRAMQQSGSACRNIELQPKRLSVPSCTNATVQEITQVVIENNHAVTFDTSVVINFSFDHLGKPQGDCAGGCTISLIGTDTLGVKIESEGYIHAI